MAALVTHLEDCPKCGSDDLRTWHSHYCQAWFVICKNCEHEAGREREEHEAIATWNREARKARPMTTTPAAPATELEPAAYLYGAEREEPFASFKRWPAGVVSMQCWTETALYTADQLQSLIEENAILAAGSCDVPGGKIGDEHGHFYCALKAENERLREAAIALRDDMLMRARMNAVHRGGDIVVEAGNGVWRRFNQAIDGEKQ